MPFNARVLFNLSALRMPFNVRVIFNLSLATSLNLDKEDNLFKNNLQYGLWL